METPDWVSLGDEELLERRISKLGLKLKGTALEPLIKQPDLGQRILIDKLRVDAVRG